VELAALEGWDRVDHRGRLDRAGVVAALAEAKLGVVLWHPTRKHAEGAVPVKLLEYLAAGVPVVASDFPALREIVERAGAGVLVDPLDGSAVLRATADLLAADPAWLAAAGERARRHVLAEEAWEADDAARLLGVYRALERRS
jgi:glycosyltransferase involved in cell wall biosynthesis